MTDVDGNVKNPADPPAPRADPSTMTISMFAVASVISNDTSSLWKYLHSFGALLFACVQNYAFFLIVVRASFPTCTSMTECPSGTFCTNTATSSLPTCYDCASIELFTNLNATTAEEVCPAELGTNKWENREYLEFDHKELWMKPDTNSTLQKCISFLHCNANDMDADNNFEGKCDYIALNKSKMDGGTWLLVIFFAVLWALPIIQNVKEAATEERVMDHHLTESLNTPAEIVRLALRIRRCMIPFWATAATLVLMITNVITAKHIILNFFCIIFLIKADNIAAVLFLGPRQQELIEKTSKEADSEKTAKEADSEKTDDTDAVWLWARVQGLFCVVILVIALAFIDTMVTDCNGLQNFADASLAAPSFLILVVGQGVYRGCAKKYEETTCVRILSGLIEFFRNLLAYSLPVIFNVVLLMICGDTTLVIQLVSYFLVSIVCLLIVIGIGTCKSKCGTRPNNE